MSLLKGFNVAGSGLLAQSSRLNTVASNMANAETAATTEDQVYKARKVVFESEMSSLSGTRAKSSVGVNVKEVVLSDQPTKRVYNPSHPMADNEGYIFMPNVDMAEEMVEMISTSRSYQMNAEVMNTSKQLMLKTLAMGEGS